VVSKLFDGCVVEMRFFFTAPTQCWKGGQEIYVETYPCSCDSFGVWFVFSLHVDGSDDLLGISMEIIVLCPV